MTPDNAVRVTPERLAQILALVGAQHYTIDMYAFTVIDVAEDLRDSRAEAASLRADVARLRAALAEITEGKGAFSMDPHQHAMNTIDDMKALARAALEGK